MLVEIPGWCKIPPNQNIEHKYLNEKEINELPQGIFYKRKAYLSRRRFIKVPIICAGLSFELEAIDNRGYWQISNAECIRLYNTLKSNLKFEYHYKNGKSFIEFLCLSDYFLAEEDSLPKGTICPPSSPKEMIEFYKNYTDLEEQGHFDDDSPDYERLREIINWIPKEMQVIDLGCNSGRFGAELIKKKCVVSGIDLSPDLVRKARLKGIDAKYGFAEETGYNDNHFDVVICCELLEHVLDPDALLREAFRIIKSGGILVGSVPHVYGEWGIDDIGYHLEHIRAFEEKSISELLNNNGFYFVEMIKQYYGNNTPQELIFRAICNKD